MGESKTTIAGTSKRLGWSTLTLIACGLVCVGCLRVDQLENSEQPGDEGDGSAPPSSIDPVGDSETLEEGDTGIDWDGPGTGRCDGGIDVPLVDLGGPGNWGNWMIGLLDASAGIEICPDLSAHRHVAAQCDADYEPWTCDTCGPCPEDEVCHKTPGGSCACQRLCGGDADCLDAETCACAFRAPPEVSYGGYGFVSSIPRCRPGDCRTDADCEGGRCGVSVGVCGGIEGFWCHTAEDECEGPEQCTAMDPLLQRCAFDKDDGRWVCAGYALCD